jgi:hypothetical protein
VCPRGTVFDRFRLTIRLVPNDVGSQIPTIGLQREGNAPRNADQIFGLQALRGRCPVVHSSCRVLLVCVSPRSIATGVRVTNVQPKRTVIPQSPFHFLKHFLEVCDVLVKGLLRTDLSWYAIVSKAPVWWTRDAAPESAVGKLLNRMPCIAYDNAGTRPPVAEHRTRHMRCTRRSVHLMAVPVPVSAHGCDLRYYRTALVAKERQDLCRARRRASQGNAERLTRAPTVILRTSFGPRFHGHFCGQSGRVMIGMSGING